MVFIKSISYLLFNSYLETIFHFRKQTPYTQKNNNKKKRKKKT